MRAWPPCRTTLSAPCGCTRRCATTLPSPSIRPNRRRTCCICSCPSRATKPSPSAIRWRANTASGYSAAPATPPCPATAMWNGMWGIICWGWKTSKYARRSLCWCRDSRKPVNGRGRTRRDHPNKKAPAGAFFTSGHHLKLVVVSHAQQLHAGLEQALGGFTVAGATRRHRRAVVRVVHARFLEVQEAVGQVQRGLVIELPVGADRVLHAVAVRQGWMAQFIILYRRLVVGDTGAQQQAVAVSVIGAQRDAVGILPVLADALRAFTGWRELDIQVLQARGAAPGDVAHQRPFCVQLVEGVDRQGFRRTHFDQRLRIDLARRGRNKAIYGSVIRHLREVPDGAALELVRDRRTVGNTETRTFIQLVQITEVETEAPVVAIHLGMAIAGIFQRQARSLCSSQALGLGDITEEGLRCGRRVGVQKGHRAWHVHGLAQFCFHVLGGDAETEGMMF